MATDVSIWLLTPDKIGLARPPSGDTASIGRGLHFGVMAHGEGASRDLRAALVIVIDNMDDEGRGHGGRSAHFTP